MSNMSETSPRNWIESRRGIESWSRRLGLPWPLPPRCCSHDGSSLRLKPNRHSLILHLAPRIPLAPLHPRPLLLRPRDHPRGLAAAAELAQTPQLQPAPASLGAPPALLTAHLIRSQTSIQTLKRTLDSAPDRRKDSRGAQMSSAAGQLGRYDSRGSSKLSFLEPYTSGRNDRTMVTLRGTSRAEKRTAQQASRLSERRVFRRDCGMSEHALARCTCRSVMRAVQRAQVGARG